MRFWVWGVVVCEAFPLVFLSSSLPLLFLSFAPLFLVFLFFFLTKSPQKFRSMPSAKQTTSFFQIGARLPGCPEWLPLPNMHENVTVCLEAVCRACKCKFEWGPEADREVSTTRETFMAALVRWLHRFSKVTRAHWKHIWKTTPLSSAVKNTRGVFLKKNVHTVTGLLMQSGHIIWGLHLVYVKHVMYLVVGVTPWLVLIMYCRKRQNWSGRTIEKYKHELTGVSLKRGSPYILASSREEEEKPYLNQTRRYNFFFFTPA